MLIKHPLLARAIGDVRRVLRDAPQPERGPRRLVVACSGGRDSVALAGVLHLLSRSDPGLEVTLGHVDHGLRAASVSEGRAVEDLSARFGFGFELTRLTLTPGPDLASRARDARRGALRDQARRVGASVVALAHTATDQAETVLLHLTRGAGLEGLAGMSAIERYGAEGLVWLRPFLELSRDQTREMTAALNLPYHDDPTNDDVRHPRVVVRQHVLPVLRGLRGAVDSAIAAGAQRAREAEDALLWWVKQEVQARRTDGRWRLEGIEAWPAGLRRRWLRAVCEREGIDTSSLGRRAIASIDARLHRGPAPGTPARAGWDLRPWRRLWIERGWLWVEERR